MQESRFRSLSGRVLLLAVLAGSTAASIGGVPGPSAMKQSPITVQPTIAVSVLYVEVPGSMEFSGQVIAKPLQFETLAEQGYSQAEITELIGRAKATLAQLEEVWYEPLVDHHVVRVPAGMTENELIGGLLETGLFEFVEPDWILYPIACPDDPRLGNQWHHNANRMQSCDAWGIETGGSQVTVGICDTGIQTSHPDFQLHRKEGYNAVDRRWENSGGNIEPVHPHGTMTTGCAAANGDNGTGVSGVGWNLSHRMRRVSNNSSGSSSLSTLTHAALTSIQAGDQVANVSYSGVNSNSVRSTATQIKNLGGLMTWAAGNDGRTLNWGDRDNDDVIVVGATTNSDNISNFSARGPSVDLMAPGSNVYTTNTNSGYGSVSGTSFSAPLTAGLIGLIWSANPNLTPDEVEAILKAGCDDLGAGGVDNTYGYGRINSYESILLAGGEPNTPPVITINSPTDGGNYDFGSSISFNSSAIDAEDGDISSQVSWTSSRDGFLGTGNFSSSSLTLGLHFISVEVFDSGGLSDFQMISIDVVNGGTIPTAPESRHAREQTPPGKVWFKWFDNSDNETGFEIQREHKVNDIWTERTTIAIRNPNSTAYPDTVGQGGWRYRVRALGSSGNSAWSAWRHSKPYRIVSAGISESGGTVTFVWDEQTLLEHSFVVERKQRVNGVWGPFSVVATLPVDSQTYSEDPGPGRYRYRVQAKSDGLSSWWRYAPLIDVP